MASTGIESNQIKLFTVVSGLLGAAAMLWRTYTGFAAGAALFLLPTIIAGCGGEVARLKLQESRLGTWLDLLSFAVPINVGVFEATRVIAFRVVGFNSALGLAYGVALRLEQIFWAGIGLLFYATLLSEKRERGLLPKKGMAGG